MSKAIHVSNSSIKSLWQQYRVRDDRLEFKTHLGTLVVPFEEIVSVETAESDVKGLIRGNLQLRNFKPALKLDWANFVEHVVLDKSAGRIKRILFTPEDPEAFVGAVQQAVAAWREK